MDYVEIKNLLFAECHLFLNTNYTIDKPPAGPLDMSQISSTESAPPEKYLPGFHV